jgi:hypothetical protein
VPITLEYDRAENLVRSAATGAIASADIAGYFAALRSLDPSPGYRVLADYSRASFGLQFEEIERMAADRRKLSGGGGGVRIAVFCGDDLVYGLGRIYQALADDARITVGIFRTRQEAEAWLGL